MTNSSPSSQNEVEKPPSENSATSFKDWFQRYWYLCLLPAFFCGFSAKIFSVLPAAIVGLVISLVIVKFATDSESHWVKWLTVIFASLLLSAFGILFALLNYYSFPFRGAIIQNLYLEDWQKMGQGVISGISAIIAVLIAIGGMRFFAGNGSENNQNAGKLEIEVEKIDEDGELRV